VQIPDDAPGGSNGGLCLTEIGNPIRHPGFLAPVLMKSVNLVVEVLDPGGQRSALVGGIVRISALREECSGSVMVKPTHDLVSDREGTIITDQAGPQKFDETRNGAPVANPFEESI
jgi:hypothetical protein